MIVENGDQEVTLFPHAAAQRGAAQRGSASIISSPPLGCSDSEHPVEVPFGGYRWEGGCHRRPSYLSLAGIA
jgi:hypothetical protein